MIILLNADSAVGGVATDPQQTKPTDLSLRDGNVHTHHRHLLLSLSLKAKNHFIIPRLVEG